MQPFEEAYAADEKSVTKRSSPKLVPMPDGFQSGREESERASGQLGQDNILLRHDWHTMPANTPPSRAEPPTRESQYHDLTEPEDTTSSFEQQRPLSPSSRRKRRRHHSSEKKAGGRSQSRSSRRSHRKDNKSASRRRSRRDRHHSRSDFSRESI